MSQKSHSAAGRPTRAALMLAFLAVSGCAWDLHGRPVREFEPLVLPSMVGRFPLPSKGWSVARRFDAKESGYAVRAFALTHADAEGKEDERIIVGELDGTSLPELGARDRVALAGKAAALAGDSSAEIVELPLAPTERFGPEARQFALRATEGAASAGEAPGRRVGWAFQLTFTAAAAPGRTSVVLYEARAGRAGPPVPAEERWRALLAAVEPREAGAAQVREAALTAGDFPKQMERGLARRSLTLPRGAFQWSLSRERWIAPGGFDGSWGLRLGITDRLELAAPGFLRYSFGEPEALTRPEFAIGAGLSDLGHDDVAGTTVGLGVAAQVRRRLGTDVAVRGAALAHWLRESRTEAEDLRGMAVVGLVWDVHSAVSLGMEAGYSRRSSERTVARQSGRELTWLGGRQTSLVTVHLPPIDVGLDGAVAWDGRAPGVLAGVSVRLTL